MVTPHGTKKITVVVLRGSIVVSVALASLVVVRGYFSGDILNESVLYCSCIVLYLFIAKSIVNRHHYVLAGWMVVALYIFLASVTLLIGGLSTPVGILAVGFVIFLSRVMLGPKHIPWVVLTLAALLLIIQHVHNSGYVHPNNELFTRPSGYFEVLVYITILGIFALISWLSGKQTEYSLERARVAEEKVHIEKESLIEKLEEQSVRLRETQLQEMVSLYKFAAIGQRTIATMHELSNLLCVLSLDIDDFSQQHQRSKAIINTKDGIAHINDLVRQARRQLYNNRNVEVFNTIPVIEQTFKDIQPIYRLRGVELQKQILQRKSFRIIGDTLNLSQILTILLNNALDACTSIPNTKVIVIVQQENDVLKIDVIDNGIGIPKAKKSSLFNPHQSSKPSGLGIGLYITRHIIENQLHGKIAFIPPAIGAHFSIELPRYINDKDR